MGYAFISYSTKNQSAADSMKQLLNRNGIESWMAPSDIPVGSKYAQVINRAIKDSSCVVLMLSNAAQNSTWVAKEVERAINYHKVIIPVQLEELVLNEEFEFYLCNNQIVALKNFDENQQSVQKLLRTIKLNTEEESAQTSTENTTDAKKQFANLLSQLLTVINDYRLAFKNGNQNEINRTTEQLNQTTKLVADEQYSDTYPDIAACAYNVIKIYNAYVKRYTDFINELRNGYGESSNNKALLAEKELDNLVNCIKQYLCNNQVGSPKKLDENLQNLQKQLDGINNHTKNIITEKTELSAIKQLREILSQLHSLIWRFYNTDYTSDIMIRQVIFEKMSQSIDNIKNVRVQFDVMCKYGVCLHIYNDFLDIMKKLKNTNEKDYQNKRIYQKELKKKEELLHEELQNLDNYILESLTELSCDNSDI